jgi:ubiquinone/menaquinone biosynthesis C-methylase UbiE
MEKNTIHKILSELEKGYDSMADKFSGTRNFFWPDLRFIADYVNKGDRILDFGCGNGRLLDILQEKSGEYNGVDVSANLVRAAKKRYPDLAGSFQQIGIQPSVPFSDDFFNIIISIAVFHHFPSAHAKRVAQELYRVLKPGGHIIITVWNLEQEKYSQYLQKGGHGFREGYIPFKNNEGNIFERYHAAYSSGEIANLFEEAGFIPERAELVGGKNNLLVAKK